MVWLGLGTGLLGTYFYTNFAFTDSQGPEVAYLALSRDL